MRQIRTNFHNNGLGCFYILCFYSWSNVTILLSLFVTVYTGLAVDTTRPMYTVLMQVSQFIVVLLDVYFSK